jgi:hypothetical protein
MGFGTIVGCGSALTIMGLQYSPDVQKKVDAKIDAGLSATTAEASVILRAMHTTAYDLNIDPIHKSALIMAWLGTLTVSLSIKADRVQRSMVRLTVAIAVMTLVLVGLTVVMLRKMP